MDKPTLVVIDDEPGISELIAKIATRSGFMVDEFNCSNKFRGEYTNTMDVIILDLMMPEVDGIEIIRFLSEFGCDAQLVLISGVNLSVLHSAQKLANEKGLHYAASLTKPFRQNELRDVLNSLPIRSKQILPTQKFDSPPVDDLQRAINENELVVYFQPQISLSNMTITGVEALVRWQHPEHGLIFPDNFIPTAEKNALIDDLTWSVLKESILHCKDLLIENNFEISINISASTFWNIKLPEILESILSDFNIEPYNVVLELTETAMITETGKSLDILTRLRMKGFQLSLDDFGTGYSSLSQLHKAPFTEIKIDKSFVMEMLHDSEAGAIVETIILLCHKLGMRVIAEGIETQEIFDRLMVLGCDKGQGYFMARPMPHTEIAEWISNWNEKYAI